MEGRRRRGGGRGGGGGGGKGGFRGRRGRRRKGWIQGKEGEEEEEERVAAQTTRTSSSTFTCTPTFLKCFTHTQYTHTPLHTTFDNHSSLSLICQPIRVEAHGPNRRLHPRSSAASSPFSRLYNTRPLMAGSSSAASIPGSRVTVRLLKG